MIKIGGLVQLDVNINNLFALIFGTRPDQGWSNNHESVEDFNAHTAKTLVK